MEFIRLTNAYGNSPGLGTSSWHSEFYCKPFRQRSVSTYYDSKIPRTKECRKGRLIDYDGRDISRCVVNHVIASLYLILTLYKLNLNLDLETWLHM